MNRRSLLRLMGFAVNTSLALASNFPSKEQQQPTPTAIREHQLILQTPLHRPLALYATDGGVLSSARPIPQSNSSTPISRHHSMLSVIPRHVRRRQQESFIPLYAFHYFVQALGKSDSFGCKHPQPAFVATCPTGAFIVSQSSDSEWQARLDCSQTSETSIRCVPKVVTPSVEDELGTDDVNGVTVACFGRYDEKTDTSNGNKNFDPWADLQISVQVEPGSYFCDKALESRSVPQPTVIAGGSVYQTVAIQKQCHFSETDRSWIFVQPTCKIARVAKESAGLAQQEEEEEAMSQTSEVPVEYEGGMERTGGEATVTTTAMVAHCEMEDSCKAEYSCSTMCSGMYSCNTSLPGFVVRSTSNLTIPEVKDLCLPRYFVVDLPAGEACDFNAMCTSGICIGGFCAEQRLADNQVCDDADDCLSQACGKQSHNASTSIEPSDITKKTCCPSGATFGHKSDSFCTASQPIGAACHEDVMCESGICVFNTCRESLLPDNMECEVDSDCVGGACAKYDDANAPICCPTRASIYLSKGSWCSARAAGEVCPNNVNSLCKSNICVEGFCQAIEQGSGAMCDNHYDCKNSACALERADAESNYICCPTGEFVFVVDTFIKRNISLVEGGVRLGKVSLRVCTGQPEGASCSVDQDVDNMCASGVCIGGTCRSERNKAGTVCVENEECENDVCALPSLVEGGGSKICCPSNNHTSIYIAGKSRQGELVDICTGQQSGAPCGDDNVHGLCDSGSCVDGYCL